MTSLRIIRVFHSAPRPVSIIRAGAYLTRPDDTVSEIVVADECDGDDEHYWTDGARFALEKEAEQIEEDEYGMVVEEGRIEGLWDE